MTQHPSLKGGSKSGKYRSVLKRYEKVAELSEKEKWNEEKDSIYHLPKVKRVKFKVKKTKGPAEETAEAAAGEPAAPGAADGTKAKESPKENKKS